MARAMNTTADQRYRVVLTWKKAEPDYDQKWRDDARKRPHMQSNIGYWEERWAKDDFTVGEISEEIIGHYDTITPVKQAMNKQIKRKGDNYVLLNTEFQVAPLTWQACDDRGRCGMTNVHLLITEYNWHQRAHDCADPSIYRCPAKFDDLQDFLLSRTRTELPVGLLQDADSGQDSGQMGIPVEFPVENDNKARHCVQEDVEFIPRLDQLVCHNCHAHWNTDRDAPESHTIEPSEPTSINVDPSATDISLMVEALSDLTTHVKCLHERLSRIEADAKSDTATLLKTIWVSNAVEALKTKSGYDWNREVEDGRNERQE